MPLKALQVCPVCAREVLRREWTVCGALLSEQGGKCKGLLQVPRFRVRQHPWDGPCPFTKDRGVKCSKKKDVHHLKMTCLPCPYSPAPAKPHCIQWVWSLPLGSLRIHPWRPYLCFPLLWSRKNWGTGEEASLWSVSRRFPAQRDGGEGQEVRTSPLLYTCNSADVAKHNLSTS